MTLEKDVENLLEEAKSFAKDLDLHYMELYLSLAETLAETSSPEAKMDISKEVAKIVNDGYGDVAHDLLKRAKELSKEKKVRASGTSLSTALACAYVAGLDVSKEVAEIRALYSEAHKNGA
ncbi:MAG: hypothetical protein V1702_04645 [Candidatus Woesearchaeota archaeon]